MIKQPHAPADRAQALVLYLSRQYSVADGQRRRLIPAALGIFGHGNVAGLGQALDQSATMPFVQGRNEQSLVHIAIGYAKATAAARHPRRHRVDRPGCANMITGAGLATVNRLPVLLLPGDTYATRRQGPVLQQLQHPVEADASVNDAFRPVSPVLRPHHPARTAAHRAAGGDAGADRPGRHRRGGALAAAGRPVPGVRLPGRVLRRARLGDPPARRRPGRVAAVARLLGQAQRAAHHRRRRRPLLRGLGGARGLAGVGIPVAETLAGKGAVQGPACGSSVGRSGGNPATTRRSRRPTWC